MEKVEGSARPDWLPEDKAGAAAPAARVLAGKSVPWRTGAPKAAPPAPAVVQPAAKRRPRRPVWETHVLPVVFLAIVILVIGGYLAGWHLG